RYLCHLGDLDRVPRYAIPASALDEIGLEAEELEIVRLIDGVSSYGDVVVESRLGRLDTYRMLAKLVVRGGITADAAVIAAEEAPGPMREATDDAGAFADDDADVATPEPEREPKPEAEPVAAAPLPGPEPVILPPRNGHLWWLVAALAVAAL